MLSLAMGLITLVLSVALLRLCMPLSAGKPRWFIGTEYEPYVGVMLAMLPILGIGFIVGAIFEFVVG